MTRHMTATQARKKFYDVIKTAKRPGMFVTITLGGLPEVVVMSFSEFEGWMETMDIMAHPEEAKDILRSMKQLKAGKLKTVSYDTLKKDLNL